jgi:hypothetical protein
MIDDVFNETMLVIYDPFRHMKGRRKVGTTSIDFAPTVLDLLGIKHAETPFLGRSIFAQRSDARIAAGLAFQGRLLVVQNHGERKVRHLSLKDCPNEGRFDQMQDDCAIYRVLRYSQYITEQNSLWPPKKNSK